MRVLSEKKLRKKALAIGVGSVLAMCVANSAYAEEAIIRLDIESQKMGDALIELGDSAGIQIIFPKGLESGSNAEAIKGSYTLKSALDQMLKGSGLSYQFISDESVVIKKAEIEEVDSKEQEQEGKEAAVDEEIVVTGSRLETDRGKLTRQITTFTREDIERSGDTRLDEFLRRLPQNINAPSNIGVGFDSPTPVRDFGLGENVFAGSGVNLRGLGSQYTLILIDGRRPAAGGQFGGITDISNIPLSRIESISVLYDGAASIYGADAVGGVLDIRLRKNYQGTEMNLTYADTTAGGGRRINFSLGHTFSWDSGSVTADVGFQGQEAIDGSQRDFALGDAQEFYINPSTPGNIAARNPITLSPDTLMYFRDVNGDGDTLDEELNERLSGGVLVDVEFSGQTQQFLVDRQEVIDGTTFLAPFITSPPPLDPTGYETVSLGQLPVIAVGESFSLYDFPTTGALGENTYTAFENNTLSPKDETFVLGLNLQQELSERVDLSLNLDYSRSDKIVNNRSNNFEVTVRGDAPANPFGKTFRMAFENDFPLEQSEITVDTFSFATSVNWNIDDNWSADFGVSISESDQLSTTFNRIRQSFFHFQSEQFVPNLQDLVNGRWLDSNFEEQLLDVNFATENLGYGSTAELAEALEIGDLRVRNKSTATAYDMTLRGSLLTLPGGDLTTSIRMGQQKQENDIFNSDDQYGSLYDEFDFGQFAVSEYEYSYGSKRDTVSAEVLAPIIGNENQLSFVQSLVFSASTSLEDYSTTDISGKNWQIGMNWRTTDWLTIRLNRAHSLKVPAGALEGVGELFRPFDALIRDVNGNLTAFLPMWAIRGAVEDIRPEKNYTTSLGFIIEPTFAEGLQLQLNVAESRTNDQIGYIGAFGIIANSAQDFLSQVDTNPLYRFADPENNPDDVGIFQGFREVQPGDILVDRQQRNVGASVTRNIDLEVRYNLSTDYGDFFLTWRHNYLDTNQVLRSDFCEDEIGEAICQGGDSFLEAAGYNRFIDTVGTIDRTQFNSSLGPLGSYFVPSPRNRGSVDLNWGYAGFNLNLSTGYQSATSIIQQPTGALGSQFPPPGEPLVTFIETTTPARSIDFSLAYNFAEGRWGASGWLKNASIRLTVDQLWRQERKVDVEPFEYDGDVEPVFTSFEVNRYGILSRGRAFSVSFSNSF